MTNIRGASSNQPVSWTPEASAGPPNLGRNTGVSGPNPWTANAESKLSSIPRQQVLSDLLRWEGDIHHMYLDSKGLVTVGIGNLVKSAGAAEHLPFVDKNTGRPATRDQIDAAFDAIAGQHKGPGAGTYAPVTHLRLSEEAVQGLVANRLDNEFLPGLRQMFPNFETYPPPAQRALIDMSYNMGTGKLGGFQHLRDACEAGDWKKAAAECHRKTCRAERNDWAKNLFLDAAKTSATT